MTTLAHVNDRPGIIVMTALFTLITILAVVLRFVSRRLSKARVETDDWLAVAGLLFLLVLNGIFLGATIEGAITGHSPVVNKMPVTTPLEIVAQKYKYAFQITEKIVFGLIKLSLLFLWKRLFNRSRPFTIMCWIMIGITIAWTLAFLFSTVFQCDTRWSMNWSPIFIFLDQCIESLDVLTVFASTDILTDIIIMFMPVPVIWNLRMERKKKIGVTSIFMVGLFTIGAGIARMYMYLITSYQKEANPDFIADFTLCILWSEIEANVAMIVCCMPTLVPVIVRCRDYLRAHKRWVPLGKLFSAERSKLSDNTDLTDVPEGNPPVAHAGAYNREQWIQRPETVSAIGFSDTERLNPSEGIVTRTEISTTYFPALKDPHGLV